MRMADSLGVQKMMRAALVGSVPVVVVLAACAQKPAAGGGEGEVSRAAGAVVPAAAASAVDAPVARTRHDEAAFSVGIAPVGSYRVGQSGAVEIQLDAKDPYHVNDEYPIKFALEPVAEVKYPASVVGKDAAKIAGQRGTLNVSLTPERAGEHRIAGRLAFSVCNDDRCLVERRDLALVITAE